MTRALVAVLCGYGVFGRRIAANLARHPELELLIAGRDREAATAFAQELGPQQVRPFAMDATAPGDIRRLFDARPALIVDTVGPFQSRDFDLARCCIEAGIHYIDIADSRTRVASIVELDAAARARGVCIISGASTVPALSTAIVDALAPDARKVLEIDIGITPGHRAPRGPATVGAILSYCGRPIPPLPGHAREYGWGALSRHAYPEPVGTRWLSNVDTPERLLWAARYPCLRQASVKAGLGIGCLHLALSTWSRGVRAHLLPSPGRFVPFVLRVADAFDRFGTDSGAMHVRVMVADDAKGAVERLGTIVATAGDGPQIPSAPAAILAKRLLAVPGYRPLTLRGAMPCIGLLTLDEILAELERFSVRYSSGGT